MTGRSTRIGLAAALAAFAGACGAASVREPDSPASSGDSAPPVAPVEDGIRLGCDWISRTAIDAEVDRLAASLDETPDAEILRALREEAEILTYVS